MVCSDLTCDYAMTENQDILFAKLNLETAVISWRELQRFFAQGKVLYVNSDEDLVAIARKIATDQTDEVNRLIKGSIINTVSDEQAKVMIEQESRVWAVVVAPWVLIQQASD